MPELPEVETTRRGVSPHVVGRRITEVRVRDARLRWPVPDDIAQRLQGREIVAVDRRAKYLLFRGQEQTLILHLGMSGSLRVVPATDRPEPHAHLDLVLSSGQALRYVDPRRFGSVHLAPGDPHQHPLLARLGPEPLGPAFTGAWLYRRSRGRRQAIKAFIMDAATVVGVGNIYAAESLFRAGIHPGRAAGRISAARYGRLVEAVQHVLGEAIAAGGTTLRDFIGSGGQPGYFRQSLAVYGRGGEPCQACGSRLRHVRLGQRSTCYCPRCQR